MKIENKMLNGFLATMVIAGAFLAMAYLLINFLEKREKKLKEKKDWPPGSGYEDEALSFGYELGEKFDRLVHAIALNQAKVNGRPWATEEDMKVAFRQAVKEVEAALGSCASGQCDEPLDLVLDKLIKKYEEEPNQTP